MTAPAAYRPELPPMPERIRRLPVHRGYPVPWFVAWINENGAPRPRGVGEPDFRVVNPGAVDLAYYRSLCWVCGEPLGGRYGAFVAGPMCAVTGTVSEPPSHPSCAGWSACACPFLSRPHARRREAGLPPDRVDPPGYALRRNPGVAVAWASDDWSQFYPPGGGVLFNMGTPQEVAWYCEGRPATRGEVELSITTGLPALLELAEQDGPDAVAELHQLVAAVMDNLAPPVAA